MALVTSCPRDLTPLLTEDEVAAFFRVTPRTVRRWAREGWLQPVRIAGTTRFLPEEIQGFASTTSEGPADNGAFAKSGEDASRGTG